jgi:DNA-binding SARP family transcriptional activator
MVHVREDMVEFGLLGPLVVRADGSPVVVSAGKQRVLLAALLLRAGQVVPAAELAGFVWEGSAPGTARVTLQNYVKRLRQALGPAGYERIVTRPSGYAIQVEPGELDVARFEQLAGAGRAAAQAGNWKRACALLGEALGLWRGEPLADVPSAALRAAEVPRLAELRLEAAEARAEAELHLGRPAGIIGELRALVAAEPLRERLWELLMLALYRSGQQAAALAAYRRARQALVNQVGIEPGPGLQEMNQKILLDDPALLLAPSQAPAGNEAPADPAGPRPANGPGGASDKARPGLLPSAVPDFTGRAIELAELSALRDQPGRPVVITAIGGTAGVGKTALAVHWARQAAGHFPDGQLYVNLRGFGPAEPLHPSEALRAFLYALGVPAAQVPVGLDAQHVLYRSLLVGKKILILLDNARDPAQVRPLLPGTADAQVLITSRAELASLVVTEGARQISLDVLTTGEARQMLAARLGPGRVADEPAAADELIGLCARLPLALAITAARAAAHPGFTLAALAAELRDARGRLDALSTGEDATDMRAVFSWSYQHLPAPAARMFRLLGLVPGPDITAQAGASLAGLAVPEARRLLRELARAHLLSEPVPGRYAFHDLLRAYAGEQARQTDSDTDRRAATIRILDHYLHTVYTAGLLVVPGRIPVSLTAPQRGVRPEVLVSEQQAKDWFDAEYHVLIAAATLAAETGFDVHAWQLPSAMADLLMMRGHWHEAVAAHHGGLEAATRLGGQAEQAEARQRLAILYFKLGDYDQGRAYGAAALGLFRQVGDRRGQARAHLTLGALSSRQGDDAEAVRCQEQALALFRAIGDRHGEAATLNDIGWCYVILGRAHEARTFCEQSISLQQELGNRSGEAHAWDSLGYAEHHLGHLAEAAAFYQHALDLYRELGSRSGAAESLSHLGDVHHADGDHAAAREAWQEALPILDDLQHPEAVQVRDKLRQLGQPTLRR